MLKGRTILNWTTKRMRNTNGLAAVSIVTLLLIPALSQGQGQGQPSDQDRVQGEWRVASVQYEGKPVFGPGAPEAADAASSGWSWIEVSGAEIHPNGLKPGEGIPSIEFAMDSTQNPRQIDIQLGDGTTYRGIYVFRGISPIVCVGLTRPDTMHTRPGDQRALITLERIPALASVPMALDKSWWKISSVDVAGRHFDSANAPADTGILRIDVFSLRWWFDQRYQLRLGIIQQDGTRGCEVVGHNVARPVTFPVASFELTHGNPAGGFDACWLTLGGRGQEDSLYVRGLYEINADKLRLRLSPVFKADSPEVRPVDLSIPDGAKGALVTMQRISGQEEADLAAALQQARAREEIERREARARQHLNAIKKKAGRLTLAHIHDDLVRFLRDFSGTRAAEEASTLLRQSKRVSELQRPEIVAPRDLNLAEQILSRGNREAAYRRFEAVIQNYPGTEWAETARKRLAEERRRD